MRRVPPRALTAGAVNIVTDAAGNITDNGRQQFTYNNMGRLFQVYEGDQLIATYRYNALGQRTHKITSGGTTRYHYGLDGNLIAESGATERDYVWNNGVTVAQIDHRSATDTVLYLHTDHLATPQLATTTDAHVAWRWDSTAFGATAPNEDADGDGTATIINLRFPGQYADQETGLYYNYFRYYDPQTGRYISSDPIGLVAGLNTFAYVAGNPLRFADPTGEVVPFIAACAVNPACAAAVAAGTGALIGAAEDLLAQMFFNGGDFGCVDWSSVAISGAVGGVVGTAGAIAGSLVKLKRVRDVAAAGRGAKGGDKLFDIHPRVTVAHLTPIITSAKLPITQFR